MFSRWEDLKNREQAHLANVCAYELEPSAGQQRAVLTESRSENSTSRWPAPGPVNPLRFPNGLKDCRRSLSLRTHCPAFYKEPTGHRNSPQVLPLQGVALANGTPWGKGRC